MALTREQLAVKASDASLTVKEAIEYALSRPTVSSNARKGISALVSGFKKAGLDIDMPYAEMRFEENWNRLSKSVGGANRFGNFQKLEAVIRPVLQAEDLLNLKVKGAGGREVDAYPLITGGKGSGSLSGGSQRTELAGERPMQGLLPQSSLEEVYATAIPTAKDTYGEVAADALAYHKATFQRPSQLFGDEYIKKSEVSIKDGEVTVKGLRRGNKSRPPVSFSVDSPVGELLVRNYEGSRSDRLFDISSENFDKAFRATVTPQLAGAFEDVLPLIDAKDASKGVVTTPSAIRSIMTRILTVEKGVPDDVVKAMMGHIDSSILTRNYRGVKPVSGMGEIITSIHIGDTNPFSGFGVEDGVAKVPLTEEQMKEVAEAQAATARETKATADLNALKKNQERITYLMSPEGQKYLEDKHQFELSEIERKGELKRKELEVAESLKQDSTPKRVQNLDDDQLVDKLLKGFGRAAKVLPLVTIPMAFTAKKAEAEQMVEEGTPEFLAYGQKGAEFVAEEFTAYGTALAAKDVGEFVAEETQQMAEQTKQQFLEESPEEAQLREMFNESRRVQ